MFRYPNLPLELLNSTNKKPPAFADGRKGTSAFAGA
jgi:hypothetical protein